MERSEEFQMHYINFDLPYLGEPQIKQQTSFRNIDQNEDFYFSPERPGRREKKNLRDDEVNQLQEKKKALEEFIHRIGDVASMPIREDILQHCQKVSLQIPHNLNRAVVMKLVKNRVDKMIKNKRIKKNWSEEDVNILIWVISKYCQFHGFLSIKESLTEADWSNIANMIPGVTGKSCMFKWLSLKKSNLAENSWIEEQSLLLDEVVKKYGESNWCQISEQLYVRNPFPNKVYRCPKQCRQHWNCYLNPQLKKGPWEKKEDYLLLRAVKQLQGVKKWAEIVKLFDGRTQNALKNRFTLIVEKEIREQKNKKKVNEIEIVDSYLKKYEQYDSLTESDIKFLKSIRNQINENQSKKKPKKQRIRKCKDCSYKQQSMASFYEQEEQYIPMQNSWRFAKVIAKPTKTRQIERGVQGHEPLHDSASYQMYSDKEEYSINEMKEMKKQEQIFYSEDENSKPESPLNGNSGLESEGSEDPKEEVARTSQRNQLSPDKSHNLLDGLGKQITPTGEYLEYLMRGNINYTWMVLNQQKSKDLEKSELSLIPYSEAVGGTIKSSASFIPCSISHANGRYLIKYLHQ